MIQQRVTKYIEKEHLFSPDDKILIALSGGADSVALLYILHTAGYHCEAAHCNFHLRGKESDRDELFVRQLCERMEIHLHTIDFNTTQYATEKHISIEMAARELRYQWFEKIRKECQADVVAVAHHQDDSIETILLNLIRGTGITGLLGIRPRNGAIVRPLLCINREEIIRYLQNIGQDYVTDSTNLEDEYTRNKIRLNLLPLMQEINPSVKNTLIDTSNYLNDVATIYNKCIEETKKKVITAEGIRISDLVRTSYLSANFAKEWKSIYIPLISTRPNMQRKNIFRLKWPHGNSATNGSRKLEKNVRQMLSLWPITRMIA